MGLYGMLSVLYFLIVSKILHQGLVEEEGA
jgi:hypothetical protein